MTRKQGGDDANEKQEIAQIGDGNAIGVITDTQCYALSIYVIALLEKAIAIDVTNVIHGNEHLFITTLNDTLIVEWCVGTRIINNPEFLQCQRERQMFYLVFFIDKDHFGNICPKPDDAAAGKEVRGQRTSQYHHERKVQQHHSNTLIKSLLYDVGQGNYRE